MVQALSDDYVTPTVLSVYIYRTHDNRKQFLHSLQIHEQGYHIWLNQDHLNNIIGPREKQCTGAPTNNNLQKYKCNWSTKLNVYLLEWYFQQNQCLNIKKHDIQQILINTNVFIFSLYHKCFVLSLTSGQSNVRADGYII